MRLIVCTLSAVLLSGCSWLGMGSGNSGFSGAGYGCATQNGYAYGAGGCAGGGGYGMAGNGYGQGAYGQGAYGMSAQGANGYGVGTGALGLRGVQGAGAYGAGGAAGYGAGAGGQFINGQWAANTHTTGTVLGGTAPYGAAVGGAAISGGVVSGGQFVNGQWVAGGHGVSGGVTTIQGAPIYVPQPYPAYYGVGVAGAGCCVAGGLRGGSAALPFGIEAGIGTELALGGEIFSAKPSGLADGSLTRNLGQSPSISYGDAYKNAISYDLAATYDINPSTTLIGRIGYAKAEGQRVQIGTVTDITFPGVDEPYYATWSDLEQVTLEGGMRKYMGGWNNGLSGIRPYVGATAGFTHNGSVSVVQDSATIINPADPAIPFIDSGWTPTASGVIGAEMQVGPRTAIGVEAGIRWRDDLNSIDTKQDRWSVPLRLRGRVSF
ncbi:MAG: hypothetical protein JKY25_12465 [Robiginitomaculum sp.]|nr:hypothetical protein [Robiginitomaculum sp.]